MRRLLAASDSSPVPNWRCPNIPSLVIFTPQRIYLGVRMDGIEALAFSLLFSNCFRCCFATFRTLTRTDLVLRLVSGGANGSF